MSPLLCTVGTVTAMVRTRTIASARVLRRIVRTSWYGIIRTAVSMSTAARAAMGMRETGPEAR